VERFSEHPLAQAIVKKAEQMGIKPLSATEFSALIGIMSVAIAVFVHEASELLAD
jgi:cation transport ATPase